MSYSNGFASKTPLLMRASQNWTTQTRLYSNREHSNESEQSRQASNSGIIFSVNKTYSLFKDTIKKYGWVALGVHISVFITTMSGFYIALRNGLDGDHYLMLLKDFVPMFKDFDIHPEWGKLGLAYGITAICGPIRYVITILGTPHIYNFLFNVKGNLKNK
eukprot:gene12781-26948_t